VLHPSETLSEHRRSHFDAAEYNSKNPQPSHFTQMVWKASTHVGCAHVDCDGIFPASFGKAHYHVCEYSPQGNVIGHFP
jgi:hypothetical protein